MTNYNYAYVFYDIKEKRVNKIYKICKKYFVHCQNSVFKGEISPSKLMKFEEEIKKIIKKEEDSLFILKMKREYMVEEINYGVKPESDIIL